MAAYVWVEITVHDPEKMKPYSLKVGETIKQYGGKAHIVAGKVEVLEGNIGEHPTKVLLEFPSAEHIHTWYNSPEYQDILGARLDNSTANLLIVEGVVPK